MILIIVVFQGRRNVCHEECIKGGVYDCSDTQCELRWCGPCQKWFHSSCGEIESNLDLGEDQEQLYLLEKGEDLFSKIISQPIRRVSRKNDAPLSLEKIQTHLIEKWRSGQTCMIEHSEIITAVKDSDLFGGQLDIHWMEKIESSLKMMGSWEWIRCPCCLCSYI